MVRRDYRVYPHLRVPTVLVHERGAGMDVQVVPGGGVKLSPTRPFGVLLSQSQRTDYVGAS